MISEMIHTASLVHDDVIDGSDIRRGKTTINNVWGERKVSLWACHLWLPKCSQIFHNFSVFPNLLLKPQFLLAKRESLSTKWNPSIYDDKWIPYCFYLCLDPWFLEGQIWSKGFLLLCFAGDSGWGFHPVCSLHGSCPDWQRHCGSSIVSSHWGLGER